MSPLIDVTNIVVKDFNQISNESCLLEPGVPFSTELKQESGSSTSTSKKLSENKPKVNAVKCNNVKHTHFKRKSKSHKEADRNVPVSLTSEEVINNRVPPIGCEENLFQRLATLSIDEECKRPASTEKHSLCDNKPKCSKCASAATGFSNGSNPPSESVSSTYKCIACGLELPSVENFATHLIKHVYEGLYAASWLNNAMLTLLPQSYSPVAEESLHSQSKAQTSDTSKGTKSNSLDKISSESSSQTVSNGQT